MIRAKSKKKIISGFWSVVSTPHSVSHSAIDFRKSRLLAVVSLVFLIGFSALFIGYLILFPKESISPLHVMGLMMIAGSYLANRYGLYRLAAFAMVIMVPLVALLRVSLGSAPDPAVTLCLLPLSLIFANMLLSIKATLTVAIVQVLAVAFMPFINRRAFLNDAQYIDVLALNFIASVLILIAIRHRDRIEMDRQSELRDSEERFRAFIEQSLVGVALVSQNRIVFVNQALAKMFAYTPGEILQLSVQDLLVRLTHPDDRNALDSRLREKQDEDSQFVWRGRTKQGGQIWVETYSRRISYGDKGGDLLMLIDITSRVQAENEKVRLTETKHQSEKMRAIGELAGGIAHDLNNQLAGIMGTADILLEEYKNDPNLLANCENILLSATRSAELIHQLLAFARKGKFATKHLQLHQLVNEVVSLLGRSIDKNIVIESDLRAESDTLLGDPSLLQNAILNLTLNARDAMPQGGRLRIRTENVSLDDTQDKELPDGLACGDYLRLSVEDTGVGISPELHKRIFEPFYSTKDGRGYGMGLAAVWGTVRSHQGWISVDSQPDQGSCFTLLLPLAEDCIADDTKLKQEDELGSRSLKVLVIDDEDVVRDIARRMLEMFNHEVTQCASGSKALSILQAKTTQVDLIILDLVMPDMNGESVLYNIRQIRSDVPVLLASGYSLDHKVRKLIDNEKTGFIQKPFRIAELKNSIARLMNL